MTFYRAYANYAVANPQLATETLIYTPRGGGTWTKGEEIPEPREFLSAASVCNNRRTNETAPIGGGGNDDADEELEIILGSVGGFVLLILIFGTIKIINAGKTPPRHRGVQYQTFPNAAGSTTDV